MAATLTTSKAEAALKYAQHAEHFSLLPHQHDRPNAVAIEAKFLTPQDPVIETANGGRLPAVPVSEAQNFNKLKDEADGRDSKRDATASGGIRQGKQQEGAAVEHAYDTETLDSVSGHEQSSNPCTRSEAPLRAAIPPSRTNPLFPPLPLYGPPTKLRNLQRMGFRVSSFFLSLSFLAVIVLGSAFTTMPLILRYIGLRIVGRNPDARRPFHEEEVRRKKVRRKAEKDLELKRRRRGSRDKSAVYFYPETGSSDEYEPLEGGKDRLSCDVGYYARRVGLDVESFRVQTEDGFIIDLWHVYNPKEYTPLPEEHRKPGKPEIFPREQAKGGAQRYGASGSHSTNGQRKYPVLLVHGLLQNSGAYCVNDDDSLAFFLCKRYDIPSNTYG